MGLNKTRHGRGERDAAPARPPVEDAWPAAQQGEDGEGRQFPPIAGQVELFPAPEGTAAEQRLLF
jgi:hypothetical protein